MHERAFEMAVAAVRFGFGVTREVGFDLADIGVRRVLVLTDPNVARLPAVQTTIESLEANRLSFALYDRVRVEPTDESFLEAIAAARDGDYDAFVAVGGGSTIDTAKAANLYTTYPPADFLDYVNPPIGKGLPVPGLLKPLFAIPTTAGTGSETTGVSIFDFSRLHAKTGIASRRLKPTLGLLDPENTRTMPPQVAASTGLDILSHAIESYTALPFSERPAPERPALRPAYQGSNPISDIWSLQALRMVNRFLLRAVADPADDQARANMLLAASYAGMGFGNAGVHLPHGMSYPVSGQVKAYRAPGYGGGHPLVPHGFSVILNAPAVFRFTAPRQSGASPRGCGSARRKHRRRPTGRRRPRPGRSHHLVHAAARHAERPRRDRLHDRRYPRARRGHAAAAPRHEALAETGDARRSRPALRGRAHGVVNPGTRSRYFLTALVIK